MLNSNTPWLVPEIMDVVRLFDCEDRDFTHYFYFERDNYINCIEYGGEVTEYHYAQPTADDIEFKRYAKRSAKLAFYELLHSITGRSFPYGALTGIRPTKLAYMETEEGRDFKDLFFQMHVLPENIDFVGRVIKTQRPYYAKKGGQELFISLPFCPTKCSYCSFITAPISSTKKYVDAYISCVERELASLKPILSNVNSIYIGGGTPFCIEEEGLERIYAAVKALNLPPCEYTVEAGRPDTFNLAKLELSKKYGVTRICVNPQSFSDITLQKIGRKHTAAQTFEAYAMAKEGATERISGSGITIKLGGKPIVKLKVRRGFTVASYKLNNETLDRCGAAYGDTVIKLKDDASAEAACNIVDAIISQYEKAREEAAERRRAARRARAAERRKSNDGDDRQSE